MARGSSSDHRRPPWSDDVRMWPGSTLDLVQHVQDIYYRFTSAPACDNQNNDSTRVSVVPDTVNNIRGGTQSVANPCVALSFDRDDALVQHLNSPHLNELSSIPGSILHHTKTAELSSVSTNPSRYTHVYLPNHGLHDGQLSCNPCRTVFNRFVKVNHQSAAKLAEQTAGQDTLQLRTQRKLRITSSTAASVPKKSNTVSLKWTAHHLKSPLLVNDAIDYAQHRGQIARAEFEKATGLKVTTTGLVVNPAESWLGASIDGLVDENAILVIKYPLDKRLSKYGSLEGLVESETSDVKRKKGVLYLQENTIGNGYYTQAQLALFCSKRQLCKLMVRSTIEYYVIVDVQYDEGWVMETLAVLRKFYFTTLLPAVTDSIACNKIKVEELQ